MIPPRIHTPATIVPIRAGMTIRGPAQYDPDWHYPPEQMEMFQRARREMSYLADGNESGVEALIARQFPDLNSGLRGVLAKQIHDARRRRRYAEEQEQVERTRREEERQHAARIRAIRAEARERERLDRLAEQRREEAAEKRRLRNEKQKQKRQLDALRKRLHEGRFKTERERLDAEQRMHDLNRIVSHETPEDLPERWEPGGEGYVEFLLDEMDD